MKSLITAIVGGLAAWSIAGAASACTDINFSAPIIPYDITQPGQAVAQVELTFSNICGNGVQTGNRLVEVWFNDLAGNSPPYERLGGLELELRSGGDDVLFAPLAAPTRFATFHYNTAAVPQVRQMQVRLPGGRTEAFSELRRMEMSWRAVDADGSRVIRSREVAVQINVIPAFEASIAGGGQTYTMAFGPLTAGETGNVNLRFRANNPFRVSLSSQYNGVMRRVVSCGAPAVEPLDALNSVSYAATLDGRAINLSSPYTTPILPGSGLQTFDNVPFVVQIDPTLNPSEKLAGSYCDVLTLKIGPIT